MAMDEYGAVIMGIVFIGIGLAQVSDNVLYNLGAIAFGAFMLVVAVLVFRKKHTKPGVIAKEIGNYLFWIFMFFWLVLCVAALIEALLFGVVLSLIGLWILAARFGLRVASTRRPTGQTRSQGMTSGKIKLAHDNFQHGWHRRFGGGKSR